MPATNQTGKKPPFIVREIDSQMLRKHPQLSKGARMLWLTLLSMANAKTGEVRHRDHWYTGREIDLRAEVSDRTRKPLMKELAVAGLVRWERERIRRVVRDRLSGHMRLRCVSGRTKYFVLKTPHKDWLFDAGKSKSPRKHWPSSKGKFPQPLESRNTPNKSEGQFEESPHKDWSSSKVKSLHGARISPASLSVPHQEAGLGVPNASSQVQESVSIKSSSSSSGAPPEKSNDDDDFLIPNRTKLLSQKAKTILISNGHDPDYVRRDLKNILLFRDRR